MNAAVRLKKFSLLFHLAVMGACSLLSAQTFDLTHPGDPVMSLDGLWRFHPGDNPAWADPKFDDSQWPLLRSDMSWSEQGYHGMYGFAWYRFAVVLPAGLNDVSIKLPRIVSAYELYANGTRIGTFGDMTPTTVVFYAFSGQGQTFKMPSTLAAQQHIQMAIRVWLHEGVRLQSGGGPQQSGGLIGATAVVARRNAVDRSATLFHYSPGMLGILLELLAAGGAFFLFGQRRSDREYLWFGILMLSRAGYEFAVMYQDLEVVDLNRINMIRVFLSFFLYQGAELFFYKHLLKAPDSRWFRLVVASTSMNLLIAFSFLFSLSSQAIIYSHYGMTIFSIPYYVWILALLFRRARERFMDARLLLVPAVLQKLGQMWNRYGATTYSLGWQHRFGLLTLITTEPVQIDLVQLLNTLFLLTVIAILIRRFTRTRSQEESYAREFADAREVQQYLIPAHLPATPGLAIESQYLPAREVGGDFFQVLPDAKDGSVLVVVGDVAGKGLQAGMLATLIVGAIRVAAGFTADPGKILALLNERLQGRGLVTCLALRIEPDGKASLANAGHLPPYLNGNEMQMDGALPLGAIAGIEFPLMHFQLRPDDSLMLMSDGVVEAQDPEGRLFGFERIGELLADKVTAAGLAAAAQKFGQEDDITVLTLQRTVPT
jgi:phosphoserine phosphatase RsbU/P